MNRTSITCLWAQLPRIQSALPILLASITLQALGRPTAPAGLLVSGVRTPLGIDRDAARFTWRSVDTGRAARQTAYQILVASSVERVAAGKADLWDSGKVDSDRSAAVEYGGKALPSRTRFWWKVRTWDQTGE